MSTKHHSCPCLDCNPGVLLAAQRAKEDAITRVEEHADPDWKAEALSTVNSVAHSKPFLTTDDVWPRLSAPHEPRAMGAIMRLAQKEGLIEPTNEHRLSSRIACHKRPIRVWRSLVFREEAA